MGNLLRNGQTVRNQIDSKGDSTEADDSMNEEYESDDTDPEEDEEDEEDDSNDVILAFIAADDEEADERPVATRSGRAITRRSEIDFSFF